MQGKIISKIGNNLMAFFGSVTDKIANRVNFTKRMDHTKLDAKTFVKVVTLGSLAKATISLEEMCLLCKEEGIRISKQGLDQRFNNRATDLMAGLFKEAFERFKAEKNIVIDLLKPFTSVEILDSSTIALPSHMKEKYSGCGGSGPEASLKLQTLLNYIDGQIDITITDGRANDQSFKRHLKNIKKGALYLQDLGYFVAESFAELHKNNAYFISRHFPQTALFNTRGDRIDLSEKLRSTNLFFTLDVFIGKKAKVPVRMIVQRLPQKEVEKRIRNIRENARRQGKTPTQETLNFAKWSICITNIPKKILKNRQVYLLYSLRWQIELFFKLCKQEAGIDKIKSKKSDRILCEIYARLICVMMLVYLCFPVRWQGQRELSLPKAFEYLRKNIAVFFKAFNSLHRLKLFINKLFSDLIDFAMKDIKRKKPATHQKLMGITGQKY